MNKISFQDEDPMQDYDLGTLEALSQSALKDKFLEER